jgi:centromere protein C
VDTFEGHGSDVKSNRLIAWAPGTENFSNSIIADQDNFKLAILFDKNREFIAAGMMLIPPNGVKSLKSTDTTYFVFYCISGVIEVTLSGNVFLIKKGCSLEVPMGNFYQFVNKGKKDATLFFVQTRGHDVDDWDEE